VYSRRELADDFRSLGVASGDVVMLHASVRAVGEVAGGPEEIHLALKDALKPDGTLMMYAGCPRYYDEVGRGNLSPEQEAEVLEKLPPFDPATARSARDNGILVEFLRTYPGSRVNPHVVRFVAWGRKADYLFSSQPWDYAYGRGSALERFLALDGKILLLGCDHDTVTFLHYVEHVAEIPEKRVVRLKVPVAEDGVRVWRDMEEFDTSEAGVHPNWPERFFARLVDGYLAESGNRGGRVGDASCYLLPAAELCEFALPVMERVALDRNVAIVASSCLSRTWVEEIRKDRSAKREGEGIVTETKMIAEAGKQTVVFESSFDAPREEVFKAYTDSKLIPEWWGPRNLTTTVEVWEPKAGGSWRVRQRDPEGKEDVFYGVFHDVTPPERYTWTFEWEGQPGHVVLETVTFEERAGKTHVTTRSVFQSMEDRDAAVESGMEQGVAEGNDRFAELLARRKAA